MIVVKILIVVIFTVLCWFVLTQIQFNQKTKASINDLRNTIDTLYKTAVENEEDKCKIYKRLADLEEREKNG